jgi:hypothetical protein
MIALLPAPDYAVAKEALSEHGCQLGHRKTQRLGMESQIAVEVEEGAVDDGLGDAIAEMFALAEYIYQFRAALTLSKYELEFFGGDPLTRV